MNAPLLALHNLTLTVTGAETAWLLRGLDLEVKEAEIHAIIGESGAGKSLAARTIVGILPNDPGLKLDGQMELAGQACTWNGRFDPRTGVAMIFQDPQAYLNPGLRLNDQIVDVLQFGQGMSPSQARKEAAVLLQSLGLGRAIAQRYPFQLSGGMQQRAMLALALTSQPRLLVADEPASALDIVNRRRVHSLLRSLRDGKGMSVLLVSHDIAGLDGYVDRISIMYAGRIVETVSANDFFKDKAQHPYTRALIAAQPNRIHRKAPLFVLDGRMPTVYSQEPGCLFADRCPLVLPICRQTVPGLRAGVACHAIEKQSSKPEPSLRKAIAPQSSQIEMAHPKGLLPVLEVVSLSKSYEKLVLDDINLNLYPGETLGLIGGSGSGKTTLARCLLGLEKADKGVFRLEGFSAVDAGHGWKRHVQAIRKADHGVQMVFQDTRDSLNPRFTVEQCLTEALDGHPKDRIKLRVLESLDRLALPQALLGQLSYRLSGGQRQRVVIARALLRQPRVLVLDEPLASLDVSIQAQVLDSLVEIQKDLALACLFISHDLDIIQYVSDRVAVLTKGRIVENDDAEIVWSGPHHRYTQYLLGIE